MSETVIISNNFNGEYADIYYCPLSGGSNYLGYHQLPFSWVTDIINGTFSLYFPSSDIQCGQCTFGCNCYTFSNSSGAPILISMDDCDGNKKFLNILPGLNTLQSCGSNPEPNVFITYSAGSACYKVNNSYFCSDICCNYIVYPNPPLDVNLYIVDCGGNSLPEIIISPSGTAYTFCGLKNQSYAIAGSGYYPIQEINCPCITPTPTPTIQPNCFCYTVTATRLANPGFSYVNCSGDTVVVNKTSTFTDSVCARPNSILPLRTTTLSINGGSQFCTRDTNCPLITPTPTSTPTNTPTMTNPPPTPSTTPTNTPTQTSISDLCLIFVPSQTPTPTPTPTITPTNTVTPTPSSTYPAPSPSTTPTNTPTKTQTPTPTSSSPAPLAPRCMVLLIQNNLNGSVYEYNWTANTATLLFNSSAQGANRPTDIAATATKLWILDSNNNRIIAYNITTNPFTYTFSAYINYSSVGGSDLSAPKGLCAVNDNELLIGGKNIWRINVSNPASPTGFMVYDLPSSDQITGDIGYYQNYWYLFTKNTGGGNPSYYFELHNPMGSSFPLYSVSGLPFNDAMGLYFYNSFTHLVRSNGEIYLSFLQYTYSLGLPLSYAKTISNLTSDISGAAQTVVNGCITERCYMWRFRETGDDFVILEGIYDATTNTFYGLPNSYTPMIYDHIGYIQLEIVRCDSQIYKEFVCVVDNWTTLNGAPTRNWPSKQLTSLCGTFTIPPYNT